MNEELMDDLTMINSYPYGEGWIFEIEMIYARELDNLMKGDRAVEWLKTEIEKHTEE